MSSLDAITAAIHEAARRTASQPVVIVVYFASPPPPPAPDPPPPPPPRARRPPLHARARAWAAANADALRTTAKLCALYALLDSSPPTPAPAVAAALCVAAVAAWWGALAFVHRWAASCGPPPRAAWRTAALAAYCFAWSASPWWRMPEAITERSEQ